MSARRRSGDTSEFATSEETEQAGQRSEREHVTGAQRRPDPGELVEVRRARITGDPRRVERARRRAEHEIGMHPRSARACSMPTCTAPWLAPPDRTKAVVTSNRRSALVGEAIDAGEGRSRAVERVRRPLRAR